MKILMVDKYFFIKGGAERYYFELKDILELMGHQVIPFSMQHPENESTPYSEHFVDQIEFVLDSTIQRALAFPKIAGRMFYSFHAKNRLEKLLDLEKPDIAHLHMIDHQLSPSILHSLKKAGIPVIQTVHQYKLVCPNYKLYNPRTGEICEKCLGGHFLHPVKERCHKDSISASFLIALESGFHRMMKIYEKNIDVFHVPSHFMGRKLWEGGLSKNKIRHLFYTICLDRFEPRYESGDYLLYFGRLSDEKGILTLLKAAKAYPAAPLYIVGSGPQSELLHTYASEHELDQVQFLGLKSGQDLAELVRNARAILVPSEWYDNSPLVIYESFAYGRPVIGARMGGISELIDHDENGLLHQAGNIAELTEQMKNIWENPTLAVRYGKAARDKAEREFDPQVHYQKIFTWYQELAQQVGVHV
ncbi:MAG: glycosyltransferase [bacterium]